MGYIRVILYRVMLGNRGYTGTMEKNMEATGLGFGV